MIHTLTSVFWQKHIFVWHTCVISKKKLRFIHILVFVKQNINIALNILQIIKKRLDLGLLLDSSVSLEFQKKTKHKNFIFSNGIDLIHEFFNIERVIKTSFLSKSVKLVSNQPSINRMFTKIADKGILF